MVIGPERRYVFSGYYCYEAKAGLNSVTVLIIGRLWGKVGGRSLTKGKGESDSRMGRRSFTIFRK